MHYTTELLIKGDKDVLLYYSNALNRWREKLPIYAEMSSEQLARELTIEQFWFEENCGSRWVGQEIMVVTGISQFYTTERGFDKDEHLALKIYHAFMQSYCSLEVKGVAEDVAKSYWLIDEGGNDD
jgi:hypothetical protein